MNVGLQVVTFNMSINIDTAIMVLYFYNEGLHSIYIGNINILTIINTLMFSKYSTVLLFVNTITHAFILCV